MTIPPIAGESIRSIFLNSFLILSANEEQIFLDKLVCLIIVITEYIENCSPEDNINDLQKSFTFKISKDSMKAFFFCL